MKTRSEEEKQLHQILVYKEEGSSVCHEILSDTIIDVSKYMEMGYKVSNLSYSFSGVANQYIKEFRGKYTFILEKYI